MTTNDIYIQHKYIQKVSQIWPLTSLGLKKVLTRFLGAFILKYVILTVAYPSLYEKAITKFIIAINSIE